MSKYMVACVLALILVVGGCKPSSSVKVVAFADARLDSRGMAMADPVKFGTGWCDDPSGSSQPLDPGKIWKMKRDEIARKVEALQLQGKFLETLSSRLCDGDFETGIVLMPGESVAFPRTATGILRIDVSDPNGLGQLACVEAKRSLASGWNTFRSTGMLTIELSVLPGERAVPVTIMEVRQ